MGKDRISQGELLQGTLPLLILRTLATGPNHGFAVARRIQQISKAVLGRAGLALSGAAPDGARRPHRILLGDDREQSEGEVLPVDAARRQELTSETERWNAIAGAIAAILQEG